MRAYYQLVKPGIVYGNMVAAVAGFFLAAGFSAPWRFAALMLGLSCVIASACVFNNILDRDIDAKMERTSGRPIPAGTITPLRAFLFGAVLGVAGFGALLAGTTYAATAAAGFGFVVYLAAYTPLKRITRAATFVGALAGSMPPLIGYAAVTGRIDATGLWLVLVLIVWQMGHFGAIALYRKGEYEAAGMPAIHDTHAFAQRVRGYVISFALVVFAPVVADSASAGYVALAAAAALSWLVPAWLQLKEGERAWARRVFFASLAALLIWCVAIAVAGIIR